MEKTYGFVLKDDQAEDELRIVIADKFGNISQLSSSIKISRSTLYRIFNGETKFRLATVKKICDALNVDRRTFFKIRA